MFAAANKRMACDPFLENIFINSKRKRNLRSKESFFERDSKQKNRKQVAVLKEFRFAPLLFQDEKKKKLPSERFRFLRKLHAQEKKLTLYTVTPH